MSSKACGSLMSTYRVALRTHHWPAPAVPPGSATLSVRSPRLQACLSYFCSYPGMVSSALGDFSSMISHWTCQNLEQHRSPRPLFLLIPSHLRSDMLSIWWLSQPHAVASPFPLPGISPHKSLILLFLSWHLLLREPRPMQFVIMNRSTSINNYSIWNQHH